MRIRLWDLLIHPLTLQPALPRLTKNSIPEKNKSLKKRILIIDDEKDLAHLTAKWVRSAGYEVELHYEGNGALEAIRSSRPDVVLLDIFLPDISGLDIYQHLQKDAELARIPVLFLTCARPHTYSHIDLSASQGVLMKPYPPKTLLDRLKEIVGDGGKN